MPQRIELHSLADTVEIAPGVSINRLGLGTYKSAPGEDVSHEVEWGLEIGYRTIDTAALYGNEASIGDVIRASGIPREEIFLATKLWNSDQGYEPALRAFDASLERLRMDYVDLYLIHWPIPGHTRDSWRALEKILESGRARAIGVCNFLPHHLEPLLAVANVPPALDQVELHPYLQQPELQEYCAQHGVTVQAWAPVMRGRVGKVAELVEIGERHGKTPAQVSIRWILQNGITTIPKSIHRERLVENAGVFDFELSAEEMATIDALDRGDRIGSHPDSFGTVGAELGRLLHPPR